MEAKDLMRVSELAPLLGVTSNRVYQLIAAGEIPATRVGRSLRVPKPALDAWLQRCTAEANRNAKLAAARRASSRPEPASEAERVVADAVRVLAADLPAGWRGSATELLARLADYTTANTGDPLAWPESGRSLSIVLRRLVAHLQRDGVQLTLGHRGRRGKRLISIVRAGDAPRAGAPSGASQRKASTAATGKGFRSSPTAADDGGDVPPGYVRVFLDHDDE